VVGFTARLVVVMVCALAPKPPANSNAAISNGLAWLGLAWLGLVWFGLAWLGLVWLGLVWLKKLKTHRENFNQAVFMVHSLFAMESSICDILFTSEMGVGCFFAQTTCLI
jgi:hypothetical protein